MRISHWLGLLWLTMAFVLVAKWKFDTYMMVALIILPLLIVMLDLQEELSQLKEEAKHQRKFVLDRYNILQEKVNELSGHIEKKIVVDFSEFAKENLPRPEEIPTGLRKKKKKKRRPEGAPLLDLVQDQASSAPVPGTPTAPAGQPPADKTG